MLRGVQVDYFLVGIGGALGAVIRYTLGLWVKGWNHGLFPVGTFIINVSGSFLIGMITTLALERSVISPRVRLAVTTGFLGGYTTFSTFSFETVQLFIKGNASLAMIYALTSIFLGLIGAWLGIAAARKIGTDAWRLQGGE